MTSERPDTGQQPWIALPIILAPVVLVTLDIFIVTVAIPSIQAGLGASGAAVQFTIAGFSLAIAVGAITAGRLGDLYGRRRLFGIGLALFTVASAACGLAPNAAFLVVSRIAQGLGGALLLPQAWALLGLLFTDEDRSKALGFYGLSIGFGGVFSQLIGGALVEANMAGAGWRSVFLVNVPVGLAALALLPRHVPAPSRGGVARLDLPGALLATAGLVAVVLPLIAGRQQHWPLWSWLCLACVPVLSLAFLRHQRSVHDRGGSPLVDLDLFRERAFSTGLVSTLVCYSTAPPFYLILTLYVQQGQRLSPLQAGLTFLPAGVGFFIASVTASATERRLGRQTPALGALVLAGGFALEALTVHEIGASGQIAWITPGLLITGYGMGTIMATLSSTVLRSISPLRAIGASAVLSTATHVGNALGVAAIGGVFYSALGTSQAALSHAFVMTALVLAGFTGVVTFQVRLLARRARVHMPVPNLDSPEVVDAVHVI